MHGCVALLRRIPFVTAGPHLVSSPHDLDRVDCDVVETAHCKTLQQFDVAVQTRGPLASDPKQKCSKLE